MALYQDLFAALSNHGIRYLVAGGFAVNFHQVQRATMDLDLILHLDADNVARFATLMTHLGYQPRVPVNAADLGNAVVREQWISEKNMKVFSFNHSRNPFEVVDVFVREPKPFAEMYPRRLDVKAFGVTIPVLGLEDLLDLKQEAGRDKDLFDIAQLKKKKTDGQ